MKISDGGASGRYDYLKVIAFDSSTFTGWPRIRVSYARSGMDLITKRWRQSCAIVSSRR